MQALHRSTVPRLFQAIEPLSRKLAQGLAAYDPQGRLLAYADLVYGPTGIYLQPLLDDAADYPALVPDLVQAVPNRLGRPLYIGARSYQPQLSEALTSLPFSLEQELALLVRHLALKDKFPVLERQPVYEGKKTGAACRS